MSSEEFKAMLDSNQRNYQDLIERQNEAMEESMEARRVADEMQIQRDLQRAADEERAINDAQQAVADEIAAQSDDEDDQEAMQASFDDLFKSFIAGSGGEP
jgi:tyrosyl-tRNA synthetase